MVDTTEIAAPGPLAVSGASLLLAQAVPAISDPSLIETALTQGGLLAFAIVLLYFWRRDNQKILEEKNLTIVVLTAALDRATTAMVKQEAAAEAQEQVTLRLAQAVERLEARRQAEGRR